MYSIKIQQDSNGELILELPDALIDALDWKVGQEVTWKDNRDGSWTLQTKKQIIPEDNNNEY